MRCSHHGCQKEAVVREAWYDDPDEVPFFASGELAYCPEHMRKYGKNFQ